MTNEDKPLRLTSKRRTHAAGASRRIVFGLSAAAAAALSSVMADARTGSATAPPPTPTTAPTEPLIVHVRVTRPWVPPATARSQQIAPQSAPTAVVAAPRAAPPTTVSRAS
jgi:hypothetical protein